MPRRRSASLLAALLLLVLTGCDDDPRRDVLKGVLVAAEDGRPLSPGRVELFDLESYEVAAIQEVDTEGRFRFQPEADGSYVPVVHMRGRRVFGLPRTRWRLERRDRVHRIEIPLVAVEPLGDTGLVMRGFVVDADTDEPIALARVEVSSVDEPFPNFSEFRGNGTTVEAATDARGFFELSPLTQIIVPDEIDPVTPSLRVQARGYRSFSIGPLTLPDIPDTLRVALERGEDTAALSGRVVDLEGMPMAGVPVLVEWRGGRGALFRDVPTGPLAWTEKGAGASFDTTAELLPAWTPPRAPERLLALRDGITDLDGRFTISGIGEGRMVIGAGYLADDGFVGNAVTGVEIYEDSTVTLNEDLLAVEALGLLAPADWAEASTSDSLRWRSVEGAALYGVRIGRADGSGQAVTVVDTTLALSELGDLVVEGTLYRWDVLAFDREAEQVSGSDRPWVFRTR